MLTGKMVRIRYARDRIVPVYIDVADAGWLETAGQMLDLYRGMLGRTRGELEDDIREAFDDSPTQLVHQGLAKLLEDRCEFEVVSGHPPEELREAVFAAAAAARTTAGVWRVAADEPTTTPHAPSPTLFDRSVVLRQVADSLGLSSEVVDQCLFADLKSEQKVIKFKDTTAERLLQRYNVALAQAVLLRSTGVQVHIRGEPPQRYRQLLRLLKFHRLVCEVESTGPDACCLRLDGPLSLFSATQKYGLQLALFLPAVLQCRDFDLEADLRWGPERRPKKFTLSPSDGLVGHYADNGMYVPQELRLFVELFRKKVEDWDISEETGLLPLGAGFWAPDYRLIHRASKKVVLLDVLGFWRRASVERHLGQLRQHASQPFVLAISEQLRVDEAELEGMPAGVHRFRQMPLPDEVVRLASAALQLPAAR